MLWGIFGDRDRMQTEYFLLEVVFKACRQVAKSPDEEGGATVKSMSGTLRPTGPN